MVLEKAVSKAASPTMQMRLGHSLPKVVIEAKSKKFEVLVLKVTDGLTLLRNISQMLVPGAPQLHQILSFKKTDF